MNIRFCIGITLAFTAAVIFACNTAEQPESNKASTKSPPDSIPAIFQSLLSTWYNNESDNYERWTDQGNGRFGAEVYTVASGDTSRQEQAVVYRDEGKWVFRNMVANQNNGETVAFTASQVSANSVTFTAPDHDFPTDVHYTLVSPDSIHALIRGPGKSGGYDTVYFNYSRVQPKR